MKKLLLMVSVVLSAQGVFAYTASSSQIKATAVKEEYAKQEPCPFSKGAKLKSIFDNTNPTTLAANDAQKGFPVDRKSTK